ncbi:hypothetical protein B0H12DRAFT_1082786 [Mycena haematopus]|nr:hypothetical protein B0H12DRAFT_1082786 [Mycena haematopus]
MNLLHQGLRERGRRIHASVDTSITFGTKRWTRPPALVAPTPLASGGGRIHGVACGRIHARCLQRWTRPPAMVAPTPLDSGGGCVHKQGWSCPIVVGAPKGEKNNTVDTSMYDTMDVSMVCRKKSWVHPRLRMKSGGHIHGPGMHPRRTCGCVPPFFLKRLDASRGIGGCVHDDGVDVSNNVKSKYLRANSQANSGRSAMHAKEAGKVQGECSRRNDQAKQEKSVNTEPADHTGTSSTEQRKRSNERAEIQKSSCASAAWLPPIAPWMYPRWSRHGPMDTPTAGPMVASNGVVAPSVMAQPSLGQEGSSEVWFEIA